MDNQGGNDPYVVCEIGGNKEQTKHITNAGASARFPRLNMMLTVEEDEIRIGALTVTVYDFNNVLKDVQIGSGEVSLSTLVLGGPKKNSGRQAGQFSGEVFHVSLTDNNGKSAGVVDVWVSLAHSSGEEEKDSNKSNGADDGEEEDEDECLWWIMCCCGDLQAVETDSVA